IVVFIAALAGSQAVSAQVPVPVAPPGPKHGTIQCELKDQTDQVTRITGQITQSDPVEGKRYPRVRFKSDRDDTFSGMFNVNWNPSNASFINTEKNGNIVTSMTLLMPTYRDGPGAIAASV